MIGTPKKKFKKSVTQKYSLEIECGFTPPLKIEKGGSAFVSGTKNIDVEK